MALEASDAGDPALPRDGDLTLSAGSPVLGATDIRFTLPQAGPARVDLLDVAGPTGFSGSIRTSSGADHSPPNCL